MIPDQWSKVAIEEIARVIRGSSPRPKGDPRYYGGTVPRLMVADVTRDGKWVTPKIDYLTQEGAKLSRPVPAGTMTVVCSGDVGVPSFLAVDACIHDGFLGLVDISPACDKDFLYYALASLTGRLERSATHGGVFTNLTTTILKEFVLNLPPLSEQRKIATILSTWDRAIELTEKLIAAKQRRKQALMQRLFGSNLSTYPTSPLRALCRSFSGGTPSRSNSVFYGGPIPWIKSGEVNQVFINSAEESITEEGLAASSAKIVAPNTILIALYGATAGKIGISRVEAAINQALLAVVPSREVVNSYLFYYLQWALPKLLAFKQGGQPNLNAAIVKGINVATPPHDLQMAIAAALEAGDREIEGVIRRKDLLTRQKCGLMQQLLTGKVRVDATPSTSATATTTTTTTTSSTTTTASTPSSS